jgi:hypothetical protein
MWAEYWPKFNKVIVSKKTRGSLLTNSFIFDRMHNNLLKSLIFCINTQEWLVRVFSRIRAFQDFECFTSKPKKVVFVYNCLWSSTRIVIGIPIFSLCVNLIAPITVYRQWEHHRSDEIDRTQKTKTTYRLQLWHASQYMRYFIVFMCVNVCV